jgi:hypothetical protein
MLLLEPSDSDGLPNVPEQEDQNGNENPYVANREIHYENFN